VTVFRAVLSGAERVQNSAERCKTEQKERVKGAEIRGFSYPLLARVPEVLSGLCTFWHILAHSGGWEQGFQHGNNPGITGIIVENCQKPR